MQKPFASLALSFLFLATAIAKEPADTAIVAGLTPVRAYSNKLKISGGPMWTDSKVYVTTDRYYRFRTGFDFMLDFQHLWQRDFGLGIDYAYHRTSYEDWGHYTLIYVGPSFVYANRSLDRFTFEAAVGLGYTYYTEPGYDLNGMGFMYKLGAEYQLTSHFGLGVELSRLSSFFREPEGFSLPNDDTFGFARFGILAGVRFYF